MKALQIDVISLTEDTQPSLTLKLVNKFYCWFISGICCFYYKLIFVSVIEFSG